MACPRPARAAASFAMTLYIHLIWCYDGREASPPAHEFCMGKRAVVPTGRISQVDVVGVATDYDEEMTTCILFRRETHNYGPTMIGDVDDIVEREFVSPSRLEAKMGNSTFDTHLFYQ